MGSDVLTPAQEILKMIETVQPNDSNALDEIDARVWAYLELPLDGLTVSFNGGSIYYRYAHWSENSTVLHHSFMHPKYTRSRDALKAIRPKGVISWHFFDGYEDGARARSEIFMPPDHKNIFQTDWLPTEELAELHAVIQAIEYERTKK